MGGGGVGERGSMRMERGVHFLHCFDLSCIQAKRENRADTEVTDQHVFVVSEYHSPQPLII